MNHKDGKHKFDSLNERENNETFVSLWLFSFKKTQGKAGRSSDSVLFYKHIIAYRIHSSTLVSLSFSKIWPANGQSGVPSVFWSLDIHLVCEASQTRLFAFAQRRRFRSILCSYRHPSTSFGTNAWMGNNDRWKWKKEGKRTHTQRKKKQRWKENWASKYDEVNGGPNAIGWISTMYFRALAVSTLHRIIIWN